MAKFHRAAIVKVAQSAGLDPDLVEAVASVESSLHTDAFRYEPAFWRRYLRDSPRWGAEHPRRVSSSYGLMQIMYVVAVERGYRGQPEGLFAPETGLRWGCRHLVHLTRWANGFVVLSAEDRRRAVLAAYNGGTGGNRPGGSLRNASYADKVLRRRRDLIARRTT